MGPRWEGWERQALKCAGGGAWTYGLASWSRKLENRPLGPQECVAEDRPESSEPGGRDPGTPSAQLGTRAQTARRPEHVAGERSRGCGPAVRLGARTAPEPPRCPRKRRPRGGRGPTPVMTAVRQARWRPAAGAGGGRGAERQESRVLRWALGPTLTRGAGRRCAERGGGGAPWGVGPQRPWGGGAAMCGDGAGQQSSGPGVPGAEVGGWRTREGRHPQSG